METPTEAEGWEEALYQERVRQAERFLKKAIAHNGVQDGLVFQSDRRAQYSTDVYEKLLEKNGITDSMSRPGCPYDNSCAESFFATLKKERIYRIIKVQ